jgi:hypothetical protein
MNSTPMTVRQTAPSPPRIDVPPTTIPARTVKDSVSPDEDCALSTRETSMIPATAAASPLAAKAAIRTPLTRTPASRAASALPPAAYR